MLPRCGPPESCDDVTGFLVQQVGLQLQLQQLSCAAHWHHCHLLGSLIPRSMLLIAYHAGRDMQLDIMSNG